MELLAFLKALVTDWFALMGGIASVVLTGLGTFRQWGKVPRPAFWAAAALCFFFAAARVWTTEHERYLAEVDKNTPQLVGNIEHMQANRGTNAPSDETEIFLLASIKNQGAPSFAEGFSLKVKTRDGERSGEPLQIPDSFPLTLDGKPFATFHEKETLYEKAATPIVKGGHVRGWLRFRFRGIPIEAYAQPSTEWTLSFVDVMDKPIAVTVKTGHLSSPMKFPGTEQPFVIPDAK
jgi:hypothetical protein